MRALQTVALVQMQLSALIVTQLHSLEMITFATQHVKELSSKTQLRGLVRPAMWTVQSAWILASALTVSLDTTSAMIISACLTARLAIMRMPRLTHASCAPPAVLTALTQLSASSAPQDFSSGPTSIAISLAKLAIRPFQRQKLARTVLNIVPRVPTPLLIFAPVASQSFS